MGNARALFPICRCGLGGVAKPNGEVAHAGRRGHLHHSPSQESDFNATKQGIASFCHQFGVARAIHG